MSEMASSKFPVADSFFSALLVHQQTERCEASSKDEQQTVDQPDLWVGDDFRHSLPMPPPSHELIEGEATEQREGTRSHPPPRAVVDEGRIPRHRRETQDDCWRH